MLKLSSSFRSIPIEETLSNARSVSESLGITRVTDITRLDRIGIPVFVSIRPNAKPGSLCVNAGKGTSEAEAQVGAYMEAIEFAFAEYGTSSVKATLATPRDVIDGHLRPHAILDFCPVMNVEIELDASLLCVEAEDILTANRCLVPAELVFLPYPHEKGGEKYFGSSSNGLSSGNNILEATIHGLAEVIERDIRSFHSVSNISKYVVNESLPLLAQDMTKRIYDEDLKLYISYVENGFNMPYFMAVVAEKETNDPIYISGGYGCHPCKEIALNRAICEAIQSRLSFIHGGRDDLIDRYNRFKNWSFGEKAKYAENFISKVIHRQPSINYENIVDHSSKITDLSAALDFLISILRKQGFSKFLRVIYTHKDFPVQVVRIIVPGLEFFNESTARVGPRLKNYVKRNI